MVNRLPALPVCPSFETSFLNDHRRLRMLAANEAGCSPTSVRRAAGIGKGVVAANEMSQRRYLGKVVTFPKQPKQVAT